MNMLLLHVFMCGVHGKNSSCADALLHSASLIDGRLWVWSSDECQSILANVLGSLQSGSASTFETPARILLIGDSNDRQLIEFLCRTFNKAVRVYIPGHNNGMYCDSSSSSLEREPASGLTVGHCHHFGVDGPPYWPRWEAHAEKGVQNVSAGRVAHDCTRFRRAAGGNPTHVFVRSAAWDYARWWYFEGNQSKNSPTAWCHGGLIDRWRNALAAFLKIVRSTFHTAALFIRTDAFDHKAYIGKTAYFVSPDCVGGMNQASREVAHQLGIGILDLASTRNKHRPQRTGFTLMTDNSRPGSKCTRFGL